VGLTTIRPRRVTGALRERPYGDESSF
jgi:hypothetical protein